MSSEMFRDVGREDAPEQPPTQKNQGTQTQNPDVAEVHAICDAYGYSDITLGDAENLWESVSAAHPRPRWYIERRVEDMADRGIPKGLMLDWIPADAASDAPEDAELFVGSHDSPGRRPKSGWEPRLSVPADEAHRARDAWRQACDILESKLDEFGRVTIDTLVPVACRHDRVWLDSPEGDAVETARREYLDDLHAALQQTTGLGVGWACDLPENKGAA